MDIKVKPMGDYQTNCYIVTIDNKDIIIDPGVNAVSWVKQNIKHPVAILNTHGHFDHIWSNQELKQKLNIPVYCPKEDAFMLKNDPFGLNTPPCEADFLVKEDETIYIDGIKVTFHFFGGHTPGTSAIEIEDALFTGDFIFNGTIGRVDLPNSNPELMKKSIHKVLAFEKEFTIYPGHGPQTTLNNERHSLSNWINYL